eukprot:2956506-Prymnesium_polylepis.1
MRTPPVVPPPGSPAGGRQGCGADDGHEAPADGAAAGEARRPWQAASAIRYCTAEPPPVGAAGRG